MRFGGLIAAIIFAAIAAVIVLRMSANNEPPPAPTAAAPAPQVKSVNIYVAAAPIPVGSKIGEDMVAVQPWPENLVLKSFIRADAQHSVVGMVARAPFQKDEPFISSKVANASDPNFLAGALPKGMRVITIKTDEIEGLAGFVFPGDRVDILLTRNVEKWITTPNEGGNAGRPERKPDAVTETLLTNVTVLAVDQRSSSDNAVDKNGNLIVPHSVSLMVSPTDAQRLRLGATKGTLTLSLRSLQDRESSDPLTITGISDISQYPDDVTADTQQVGSVVVIRGTDAQTIKDQPKSNANQNAPRVQ